MVGNREALLLMSGWELDSALPQSQPFLLAAALICDSFGCRPATLQAGHVTFLCKR